MADTTSNGVDKRLEKLIKNRDFWLVALIIVLGFTTGLFKGFFTPPAKANVARLEIDYGDRRRAFEGEVEVDNMSVLDALLASSRAGNFEVRYAILNDQTDIMKINGFIEDGLDDRKWSFYLNGQRIEPDKIHKVRIKAGDKVLIKLE